MDYLELKWKDGISECCIFPISYSTFLSLWHRTLMVAGLQDPIRSYAMRIGAGGRLDGEQSLDRGNTDGVFMRSYQPRKIGKNLAKIANGPLGGPDDAELFDLLRRATLMSDKNAPIYPAEEDLEEINQRGDIRRYRATFRELSSRLGSRHPHVKALGHKINNLISTLSSLAVKKSRQQYFEAAGKLRCLGLPTEDVIIANATNPKRRRTYGEEDAEVIGDFFYQGHMGDVRRTRLYVNLIYDYLRHLPCILPEQPVNGTQTSEGAPEPLADSAGYTRQPTPEPCGPNGGPTEPEAQSKKSVCLLCRGAPAFSFRTNMTRHTILVHITNGTTFSEPFPCPECRRLKLKDYTVNSPPEWSNHVERHHGKENAPTLYSGRTYKSGLKSRQPTRRGVPSGKSAAPCFFCACLFVPGQGFSRHISTAHRSRGQFEQLFSCPECHRQEGERHTMIDGYYDWLSHMSEAHGRDGQTGEEVSPTLYAAKLQVAGRRKRRRDDDDKESRIIGSTISLPDRLLPAPKRLRDDRADDQTAISSIPIDPVLWFEDGIVRQEAPASPPPPYSQVASP